MNNFDLLWKHVKNLAEKMIQNKESLLNDKLYQQYCLSFNQLMQIAENEPEIIDKAAIKDIRNTIHQLEQAYIKLKDSLKNEIEKERIKASIKNAYKINDIYNGYDKTY